MMGHFCPGASCAHPSHYAEGGNVNHPKASPSDPKADWQKIADQTQVPIEQRKPMYAEGGKVKGTNMYAMEPDVPAMHGYDEGGEVEGGDLDQELMEMACEEFCEAMQRKDKKGILEALRAIIYSVKE